MRTDTQPVRCGNCGSDAHYTILVHADELEPPDLDTRPGEPLRSSLPFWIKRCASCGYCADEIDRVHEEAGPVIESPIYQAQLSDARFPEKANEFICYALILERVGQYADAGWTAMHAAWVCDDSSSQEAASLCRQMAVRSWTAGKRQGQAFHETHESEFLIVSDVHRRLGEFEHALTACNLGAEGEDLPDLLDHCFRLERSLISRKELGRGSLRDLPMFSGGSQAVGGAQ
ncbi:MAG: hypothetical protein IT170_01295 [Bryobacterales bacterium]|nr:hypothetical protein [Bryobacterales bacterium]